MVDREIRSQDDVGDVFTDFDIAVAPCETKPTFPLFYTKSMNIYAIDFETYYDKEYSVVDLGYWHYTHHEKFNAYMVSIVGDDGNEYAGDPKEFDWGCIHDTVWLSHNANFDAAVFERLKELGIVPAHVAPREWHDTADLVTYLGYPRSLKEAMAAIYKIEVNKSTRDNMTGKSWESMTPEFKQEVTEYALKDSRACVKLWADLSDAWPKHERELSRHTRTMCTNGLPIDLEGCEADIRALELKLWQARKLIPWADNEDAKVLSPKALAEECRKHGIRAPKSLAQDSPDFDLWKEEFSDKYPFAQAMSDYRRINAILLKFKTMRLRTRPNRHMGFGLKYFGAHTGRWSGDTGFNVQNMPRADLFEVNLRKRIVAPNGKTLVVCDLSNIEPRCMAILANDTEMLNALQSGIDVYEAHARATLGYTDPRPLKEGDPLLRQVSKVRSLGLGYGCGWHKFATFAEQLLPPEVYEKVFGAELEKGDTERFVAALNRSKNNEEQLVEFQNASESKKRYWVNSWKQVDDYRKSNPANVNLWSGLDAAFKLADGKPEFTVELPSGRILRYKQPKSYGGSSALIPRLGKLMRTKVYGGLITENITQATARDVFADCLLRLEKAGYEVILHAHDEAVCLVDEDKAEEAKHAIEKIMSTPPEWMPELPQAAEAKITKAYTK